MKQQQYLATFSRVNHIWHVEITDIENGDFICGGNTGCRAKSEALIFARKVAKSHGGALLVNTPSSCRPTPRAADPNNIDTPPICTEDCRYRVNLNAVSVKTITPQTNALRMETTHMVATHRCGWNLLPGKLGGHPLDYAPCTYTPTTHH